jgi:hypothetical protein
MDPPVKVTNRTLHYFGLMVNRHTTDVPLGPRLVLGAPDQIIPLAAPGGTQTKQKDGFNKHPCQC